MAILSATSGVFIKSLALGRPIVAGEKIDGTAKRKFLQWFWDLCVPHGLRSRPVEWCKSGRVSACGSVVATMP
ncbi:hypothetical protein MINTM007_21330 [Mycobacterium intracellulare]|nr:hypothetical protein MINTM007_21330 [Mycobacterium intracellulare]